MQQLIDRRLIEKVSVEQISLLMQKANYEVMIKAYLDFVQLTLDYPKITSSSKKPNQANFPKNTKKSDYEMLKEILFSEAGDPVKRVATLKELLEAGYFGTLSAAGYNLKLINENLLQLEAEANTDESKLKACIQAIQIDH